MFDDDDMDIFMDIPGGDDFEDVTDLFDVATTEMASGEVAFLDGFTLLDSMSAFEIGEPRMDSGMILEQDRKPPFDPLIPLLPQEICWILDRSFACEMEWHAGNTLSQTVYTLLYAISTLEGLLVTVLRSGVVGLLKSCDMGWRELSKGKVQDVEDWQGEKCDISLLEGTPAEYVVRMLDDACLWLQTSALSADEKSMLMDRLLLRKSLLELFRLHLPADLHKLRPFILIARNILDRIRSQPAAPTPASNARALDVFDPHITRRLHNFIPIRVVEFPSQDKTWDAIDTLLRGWDDLDYLLSSHSLFTWSSCGATRATFHKTYPPFIRSLIQTSFHDKNTVLGIYPLVWIVEHYFAETLGITYEAITHTMRVHWTGSGTFSTKEIERMIITVVVSHIRSHWFNPPRRRRHLMKSIVEWQILHDGLRSLVSQVDTGDLATQALTDAILATPLLWQISVAREIVLSGFQQELYTAEERPVAYWYAAQILKIHLTLLVTVQKVVPEETHAHAEMQFQTEYLTGLHDLCLATCVMTYQPSTRPFERMRLNFRRRFKWLFTQVFPSNREELVIPVPDFEAFVPAVTDLITQSSVHTSLENAKTRLLKATEIGVDDFVAPSQARDRLKYVRKLVE
ncbi:hypothetical protein EIP91_003802, partial [Steccherinum ochraceum]